MNDIVAILMKVISVAMIIIFIFSTLLLILTFRKPKKFSILSQIITVAVSFFSLVIFSALTKYEPGLWMWFLMGAIGLAIGITQARTTKIYIKDNKIMSQNSVWYLAIWAAIFVFNQLVTTITNRPPDIAMAMLIIGTATVWGTSGNIIRRYYKTISGIQPQSATSPAGTAPSTSTPAPAATKPAIQEAPPDLLCPKCQAKYADGDLFCMNCGGKL